MKRFVYRIFSLTLCLSAIFTLSAIAQTVTGSLVGHVEDIAGAVVPGARVTITEVNRGTTREITTNEEGNYSISSLDPGIYRVEIQQANFKKFVRENVEVGINTTVRVDTALEAGTVSETVQVESEQVQLKTDRADVSTQITSEQVEELPLSPDRNYQSVLDITPGVTEAAPVGSGFGNPNGSLVNRVNGQNERYNNFQLDGTINNQTNVISQTAIVPPPEAIQVVDVSTNSYDAEQGRAAGGVVNVQIKSGTNKFRGSTWIYNTNSAFSARNTFSTIDPPNTNLTQFGFTVGGPIIKDKTFFFGDYQGGRDRRGQNELLSVPIAAFRNGDFSSAIPAGTNCATVVAGCIYDPGLNGQATPGSRVPFAGNMIPQNRISPAARAILALLPLPNRPGLIGNYEATGSFIQDRNSFDVKINHNFSESTTMFGRYSFFKSLTSDLPSFGALGGPSTGGVATASIGPGRNDSVSVNLTHVFSPKLITEFRFGYVRVHITGDNPSEENLAATLGIPGINLGDFFSSTGIPRITFPTGTYAFLGSAATLPFDIKENSFNIVNNWTRIIGNHTIRFGADIRQLRLDKLQASGNSRGQYAFTGGLTTRSGSGTAAVNAFAAFLLGLPQTVDRTTVVNLGGYITPQYFFFAQDRWQVNPKLTVNYGLRYEIYPYPSGIKPGDQSYYDPETNTVLVSGYGPNNDRINIKTQYDNFAPRLGVAYRLDDKTVIRTGYGISYVPLVLNTLATQNYGSQINTQFVGTTNTAPRDANGNAITFSTGIPAAQIIDLTSGIVTPPGNVSLGVVNPNARRSYIQSYNFTVERDLYGFVMSVGYVGSRGTRLPTTVNINAVAPRADRTITNADRPLAIRYGRTADVFLSDFMLSNAYHSLQARVDKRFKQLGGKLTVAYTLSRAMDHTSAFSIDDDFNYSANWGPSDFDRTHNLVVSHVVRLPFGRKGLFFKEGIGAAIFGGFTLSGVFAARSGSPIDITGTNAAFTSTIGSANRPNQIADPFVAGPVAANPDTRCQLTISQGGRAADVVRASNSWFNRCAFDNPAPGTFGNTTRNSLRGPGYFNYNATLARTFSFGERFRLQAQMTAFNITNTPHFRNPSGSFSTSTTTNFGVSTTTFGERQIRFGLKLSF
ncbi:MAG: carboxypeptidase regulatory-like domain-containing protein [Acidobacteriota bacterium]|nr:carboxypeptidase regulatory-like domain-containing protein [Acidobacteriota bacterium]